MAYDDYGNYYEDFAPTRPSAGGGYGQPAGPLDPWQAIISQGIEAARDITRGATSNYPYTSPDDPYARRPVNVGIYPAPTIPPYPAPGPSVPTVQPAPQGAGIQLSTTTLMLLVGGVLLFSLGKSRR